MPLVEKSIDKNTCGCCGKQIDDGKIYIFKEKKNYVDVYDGDVDRFIFHVCHDCYEKVVKPILIGKN